MFLTPDQVQTLTGFKRPAKQREALRQMRIRHYVRPDGRPMVVESDLEAARKRAGHTREQITKTVYRLKGEKVKPMNRGNRGE